MRVFTLVAGLCFLSACGEQAGEDIREIASLSEDANNNLDVFIEGIQRLSKKPGCSLDAMREYGGFWRVSGAPLYFIHCGDPPHNANRWYINPRSGEISQSKSAL